jgi:elongator complex protein 1
MEVAAETGFTMTGKKGSKVNRICDGFLTALEKRSDTNLHNLITAHVCKLPPDLESGLQLVARLRGLSCYAYLFDSTNQT